MKLIQTCFFALCAAIILLGSFAGMIVTIIQAIKMIGLCAGLA